MLAIGAATFDAPSETFIRDHVRHISPRKTVLLCRQSPRTAELRSKVLAGLDQWTTETAFFERAQRALKFRWQRYMSHDLVAEDRVRVVNFLKDHQVSVVLAEFMDFGTLLASSCDQAGVRLVIHAHGYDVNILGNDFFWRSAYKRKIFSKNISIVCASNFLAQRLIALGSPADSLYVNPLGVDLSDVPEHRPDCQNIICISRLIPQKGVSYSIRAFAEGANKWPDTSLEIIGDGPERLYLEKLVIDLGLSGRVVFHGAKPHSFVLERLSKARLFLQHCVTIPGHGIESFGLSVIEAMGTGVPVVVTKHGALPETVVDGVTGILVEEKDVQAMASAIEGLLLDKRKYKNFSNAARLHVSTNFNQPASIERLRSFLGISAV